MTEISLKFYGKDEVIKIIDTRGSIVDYLSKESSLCPLIGSEIQLFKELGKGAQGIVYQIKFPGIGKNEYVVKTIKPHPDDIDKEEVHNYQINEYGTLKALGESYYHNDQISLDAFMDMNGGKDRDLVHGEKIYIPIFAKLCKLHKNKLVIPVNDAFKTYFIREGRGYACDNAIYSEYVLMILLGEMYRKSRTINFMDVFDFATCYKKTNSMQYIFMEKISPMDVFINNDSSVISNIIIQLLFSIASYQRKYLISHNDLHPGNIFAKVITLDTRWNGEEVLYYDYFSYDIDGVKLYIPNSTFIIKIGDFGLACKYSDPCILLDGIVDDRYKMKNITVIPNWLSLEYDSIFCMAALGTKLSNSGIYKEVMNEMMFDLPASETDGLKYYRGHYQSTSMRPEMNSLKGRFDKDMNYSGNIFATAEWMLKSSKSLEEFRKPPPADKKILEIGKIDYPYPKLGYQVM
jgi:serine/threonine protein kinase